MNKPDTGIINIHGKAYQTVAYRVQTFRASFPFWTLQTSIIHRDDDCVVMLATISDDNGRVISTGHAEEYRRASTINKTSALENAETSAIGRALAGLGIGGTEFASADEVARAVSGQKPSIEEFTPSGAGEVSPERQDVVRLTADACIAKYAADDEWGVYEEACGITDQAEKLLLWSFLKSHSKVRSCIKRMAELEKQEKAA